MSSPAESSSGAEDWCPSRRAALRLSALGGAAGVLAGCAVYGESSGSDAGSAEAGAGSAAADPGAADPAAGGSADPSDGSDGSDAAAGGTDLGRTSQVPIGGGKIFAAEKVVVTQPTIGAFQAFSTTCTHQGCDVSEVKEGTIRCTCHGSRFRIADGSVADGPARKPLQARKIAVAGESLKLQ